MARLPSIQADASITRSRLAYWGLATSKVSDFSRPDPLRVFSYPTSTLQLFWVRQRCWRASITQQGAPAEQSASKLFVSPNLHPYRRQIIQRRMKQVDDRLSWTRYQPGLAGATAPGADEGIAERRYALEPHILDVVPFDDMHGDVVELGCGVGTDGLRISAVAKRYIGVDYSPLGLRMAFNCHEGAGRRNSAFIRADLSALPFADRSFDYVYSHGVVHHVRADDDVWREASRVLRPGGRFCVMVYHRGSINYRYGIQILRRVALLVAMLARPVAARLAAGRGEDKRTLAGHAANLKQIGARYLVGSRWLSANTDGPGNTYSRVYSREELRRALNGAGLTVDAMEVRYLNVRVNPPLSVLPQALMSWMAKRWGWHLYAIGHKN